MTNFLSQNNKFKFNNPQIQFHSGEEQRRQSISEQKTWQGAHISAPKKVYLLSQELDQINRGA